MYLRTHIRFWAIAFLILLGFLWLFQSVFLPFVAGFILAYLLNPAVERLMAYRSMGRVLSTISVMTLTAVLTVLFFWLFVPILTDQFSALMRNIPTYLHKLDVLLNEEFGTQISSFIAGNKSNLPDHLASVAKTALGWSGIILLQLFKGGMTLINIFTFIVIVPVVAFYILLDWDKMVHTIDSWLPRQNADTIRGLLREIDKIQSSFIRGQAAVCILQAVYYSVVLSFLGLDYAFIIGLVTGILTFIPYVGASLGFVLAALIGLAQFSGIGIIIIIGAIYLFGQVLEGYFWIPKLIGESVELHPVWIMFSLMAFGSLFGFMGMLIAVPVTAAFGVLCRFGIDRYKRSAYYLGDKPHSLIEHT